ncbi:hypothetical protein GTY67_29905 [Streptomyces sp. SID8374]|uniref:hypothetical protein n=1 Tax=Streptomyces sp. SID8374 TaxID=2690354 RepID=UPI001369CD20|nr:hypothetical protein [Streptomyces sp. SID8374]MYX17565.1 hypothetical protein [Streptomyces sp. SID8374]
MTEQATQQEEAERDRVLEAVLGPISEAYYSESVRSGSGARLRAQAAQSTVTLFAGGLVATLAFTGLADRPAITRVFAVAAILLWLVAAFLYVLAVATLPKFDPTDTAYVTRRIDLVNEVLKRGKKEAEHVDSWQTKASWTVGAALLITLITYALALGYGPEKETASGAVLLRPAYAQQLRQLCGSLPGSLPQRVEGKVDTSTLKGPFVRIELVAGACGSKVAVLQIPRSEVTGMRLEGD